MKTVILAGGYGTRISEESYLRPKPMIEIDGKPLLWHIMKTYSHFGYNDFIICVGYKGNMIKEYFANYYLYTSDITFDFRNNNMLTIHSNTSEPWEVTIVDTGLETLTGGRVKRIRKYLNNETFMLTYGDGLADVNIKKLMQFHKDNKKLATVTSAQLAGRFGALKLDGNNNVRSFYEKPKGDNAWINAGFFVLEPGVIDLIEGDSTTFEKEPIQKLIKNNQLVAYKHDKFWQPCDTIRDKQLLEDYCKAGKAPWMLWK